MPRGAGVGVIANEGSHPAGRRIILSNAIDLIIRCAGCFCDDTAVAQCGDGANEKDIGLAVGKEECFVAPEIVVRAVEGDGVVGVSRLARWG